MNEYNENSQIFGKDLFKLIYEKFSNGKIFILQKSDLCKIIEIKKKL